MTPTTCNRLERVNLCPSITEVELERARLTFRRNRAAGTTDLTFALYVLLSIQWAVGALHSTSFSKKVYYYIQNGKSLGNTKHDMQEPPHNDFQNIVGGR